MTTTPSHFDKLAGENVRRLRLTARLTQTELGEAISTPAAHYSQHAITRIERGIRPLRFEEAARLAAFFGVAVVDLVSPVGTHRVTAARTASWDVDSLLEERRRLQAREQEVSARLAAITEPSIFDVAV